MAQNPKILEVVATRPEGPVTRVLTIREVGGTGHCDIGGKYIIVHTGLVRADKAVKRAYSLIPSGAGEGLAELAVKRIGAGAGALHEVVPGATFGFSGPWGKLIPESGLARATLVVATDTGITSALGIASRSAEGAVTVLWLRAVGEAFLSPDDVRGRLDPLGVRLRIVDVPEVGAPGRFVAALPCIEAMALESAATHVVATGDGDVVYPLKARLPGKVGMVEDVRVECFFNNPEKKSV